MAHLLVQEGCRFATALAHQNPSWPYNDAVMLRQAAQSLQTALKSNNIPLNVYPTGEVLLTPDTLQDWRSGRLLSYGDRRKHLLIEMPGSSFFDLRPLSAELAKDGIRIVLAHTERYEPLLDDIALVEQTITAGCLIQVSTGELAEPSSARHERAMKLWASRGMIHCLGSDGHQINWRRPLYRRGYERLVKWVGHSNADCIAGIWSPAILQGLAVAPPKPRGRPSSWWTRWFKG
jgi:protein-tyrosine phosphatase